VLVESVFEDIVGILFFVLSWPGIIVSLLLVPIGLIIKKFKMLIVSALLSLPFTYVISLYTIAALMIPICLFSAAYLAFKKMYKLAATVVFPVYIFVCYLAHVVVNQSNVS